MKILIIMCSKIMDPAYIKNICVLRDYMNSLKDDDNIVDYCGISSNDDFKNYEEVIQFKYKIVNPKLQCSKVRDFITEHKDSLDYDWYIKIRPEIKLLQQIDFSVLSNTSINARVREYTGPKHIKYGSCVGGVGVWNYVKAVHYDVEEKKVVLDDQIYIFHMNAIKAGVFGAGFEPPRSNRGMECEWYHTAYWKSRNISLNIIGINIEFTRSSTVSAFSADINPL